MERRGEVKTVRLVSKRISLSLLATWRQMGLARGALFLQASLDLSPFSSLL